MLPRKIPKAPKRSSRWSREELCALLHYDRNTGFLYWLPRNREMFSDERSFKTWNSRFADRRAFTADHSEGYKVGRIKGANGFAHRVIWAMLHGEVHGEVDHINGDRSDNRLCNLRLVTREENRLNVKSQRNSPNGVPGVYQRGNKWEARIQHDGWQRSLGRFPTRDEAIAARKAAELSLGFHPNHGRV